MNKDIPEISLQRLPVYLNYLRTLSDEDGKYISSGAIASALKLGEVLVRKDLAYTSSAGRPKLGYVRTELIAAIEEYLGCNDVKNAVLVGAGGLGCALLSYGGFGKYGIEVVEAFDNDPAKEGMQIGGKTVHHINNMREIIERCNAKLAIVAVPARAAQGVCDLLIAYGIKGILNFAPVLISAPDNVVVRNIDVAANLAILKSMI